MIPIQIKIVEYDYERNICKAKLQNGNIVDIDPFVGCAIPLSDEEYKSGKGGEVIGKSYVLTAYTVYTYMVVPHEGGMVEL